MRPKCVYASQRIKRLTETKVSHQYKIRVMQRYFKSNCLYKHDRSSGIFFLLCFFLLLLNIFVLFQSKNKNNLRLFSIALFTRSHSHSHGCRSLHFWLISSVFFIRFFPFYLSNLHNARTLLTFYCNLLLLLLIVFFSPSFNTLHLIKSPITCTVEVAIFPLHIFNTQLPYYKHKQNGISREYGKYWIEQPKNKL